ncbi:MAG: hypothetical protein V1802_01255 [Candidatus Aenigmatarchaeota archaeon]
MVGFESLTYPITILAQYGANPLGLLLTILLGYSILFIFFSRTKEWNKLGEVDKIFISSILGIAVYFYLYFVLGMCTLYQNLLTKSPEQIKVDNNVIFTSILLLLVIWLAYLGRSRVKKLSMIFIELVIGFLFCISIIFILIALSTAFSSYAFLLPLLLLVSVGMFAMAYILHAIYTIMENKELYPTLRRIKNQYSFALYRTKNKYKSSLQSVIKNNYKFLIIGFIIVITVIILILSMTFPRISYGTVKIQSYYLNANLQNIENSFYNQFVDFYKYEYLFISIKNIGQYGWIPIDYSPLIANLTLYQEYRNFEIKFIVNESLNISYSPYEGMNDQLKGIGINRIEIDNTTKKIFLFIENDFKISNLIISGFEKADIDEMKINITTPAPVPTGNNVTFPFYIANEIDHQISIHRLNLQNYAEYNYQYKNCTWKTVSGYVINLENNSKEIYGDINKNCDSIEICDIYSRNNKFFNSVLYKGQRYIEFMTIDVDAHKAVYVNITFSC